VISAAGPFIGRSEVRHVCFPARFRVSPKTTAPAFPLLGGDWLKGTSRLSAAERGYYVDLLLFTWDSDEPIPDNETELMQIARCTSRREWRKVWARLRTKWVAVEGGFRNKRCEEERTKLAGFRRKRAEAGKAGAESRWHDHNKSDGKNNGKAIATSTANGWPSISSIEETDSTNQNQSPAPTRELLTLFSELHQKRFGTPAEISGKKDGAILAAMFRQRGLEETRRLVAAFFELRDPWVQERGFSVGVFKTQIAKLLAKRPARQPAKDWRAECAELHGSRCTNVTFHEAQMDAGVKAS
jgi:uncharacterized protein YdaU (DUF1376 family)